MGDKGAKGKERERRRRKRSEQDIIGSSILIRSIYDKAELK